MSDKKARVETYFEGFRRSDHTMILALLTRELISRVESYLVPLNESQNVDTAG